MPLGRIILGLLLVTTPAISEDAKLKKPETVVAPAKAIPRSELKSYVTPGAPLKFEFPELPVDRRGATAACNVKLPANYETTKKYPLVVWLAGGDGGNEPNGAFLPVGDFILVGLPYPKGANNPLQSNMVGDYAKVWTYHLFMLEAINQIIPNIDKSHSIIAGFSNGAHSIDGMLRLRGSQTITDYFNVFVFIEGGGTPYTSRGILPNLKGKFAYVGWGSEKGSNKQNTSRLAIALEANGATVVGVEMANIGHAFPEVEQAKVRQWINTIAMDNKIPASK